MKAVSKETEQQCNIYSIVQYFFNKVGWKIVQKTCKHENKHKKWIDYQDRYYEYYCPDCNSKIYESMD